MIFYVVMLIAGLAAAFTVWRDSNVIIQTLLLVIFGTMLGITANPVISTVAGWLS